MSSIFNKNKKYIFKKVDFKSALWYNTKKMMFPPVAQLDNAADSDSEERGFESLRAGQKNRQVSTCRFFSYIRLSASDMHLWCVIFASQVICAARVIGEYNITEAIRLQYHFHEMKIPLCRRHNITANPEMFRHIVQG